LGAINNIYVLAISSKEQGFVTSSN